MDISTGREAVPPILRGQEAPIPAQRLFTFSSHPNFPLDHIEMPWDQPDGEAIVDALPHAVGGSSAPTSPFPEIPQKLDGTIPVPPSDLETPVLHVNPRVGSHVLVQAGEPPSVPAAIPISSDVYHPMVLLQTDKQDSLTEEIAASFLQMNNSDDGRRRSVQEKLTSFKNPAATNLDELNGYIDTDGYVVEWQMDSDKSIRGHALGEATYFTAITVVGLASAPYAPGSWAAQNAGEAISRFLDVLENKSWGNTDADGWSHPIRHPAWFEYYGNGGKRNRPMSRDAFNQIVLACFYAYKCTHGTSKIQHQAQSLLQKWITYLAAHSWVLHSNFIQNEFETEKVDGKSKFANLFADESHMGRITAFGQETYALWPHELWALRNCAMALNIPHLAIAPALNFAVEIEELYILPLVRQSGDVIEWLYDRLQFHQHFSLDLVPGWKKSRVSGTFSIGLLPPITKRVARDLFERTVRDQLLLAFNTKRDFEGIIRRCLQPLAEFFFVPELLGIVETLMSEILPWANPAVLAEIHDFLVALQISKLAYKPESVGYSFWASAMELEARPYLRVLFEPLSRDYFGFLAKSNNPNGLWAWLAGRNDVVAEQLLLFESQAEDYWVHYAYGENPYNEWRGKTKDKEPFVRCSRLDYLVLRNLAQRGRPSIPPSSVSFDIFVKLAEKLFKEFIDGILRDVLGLGYVREFVDAAGKVVREVFTSDTVEQVIRLADGAVLKNVFRPSGEVEQVHWDANGTFQSLSRYAKIAENGVVDVADMIENRIRGFDGVLEIWNWTEGKVLTQYVKYVGTPLSGAASAILRTVLIVRDISGALTQWIHATGVLQSFTKWVSSDIMGYAKAIDCTLQTVRAATAELLQWTFHPDGALKEFSRWLQSTLEGGAEGIDMVFVGLHREHP